MSDPGQATHDLSSLQPESIQVLAQEAVLSAHARQAAAQEVAEEHDRLLHDQAASYIAERSTQFDSEAREWAQDVHGVITDLDQLTQQAQAGLLTADETRHRFDKLNAEVARYRRLREDLARQIETLEAWESDPMGHIRRWLPPGMRRPL
jgi:uncharacterized coiled-coil DUF342 family protein